MKEMTKMLRKLLLACAFVLCGALVYAIPHVAGNAVATSDTSAKVMFSGPHGTLFISNTTASDEVYIRVWQACETEATITTTTAGTFAIRATKTMTFYYDPAFECGGGYIGFSYIMASGKTGTIDYIAK